jgi:hypothetical protein
VSAPHCGSLREHYPAECVSDYEPDEHYEPDPGPPVGFDEYEPEPPAPVEEGPDWWPDDGPFDSSEWPF